MKKNIIAIVIFSLVFLGLSPLTRGAGFLIYEHGAAAMAMGGAFVAVADNPTAIFHNPAGIAWLDGTQISLGSTLIIPKGSLSLPNWPNPEYQSIDQESQVFYPSTFYISRKLSDRIVAGFGFFSPYGLGIEWPDPENFPLRYISTKDDMKTFFFNPVIAFKLNDNLSVGFGASYIYSTLALDIVYPLDLRAIPGLGVYEVPISLEKASGSAWGLNAGALYRGEKFSFGFNWRGGFSLDYEGDLSLDMSAVPIPLPESGTASTSFNFPHILGIGASFNLTDMLILTADIHYILWSSYEEIAVDVDVPGLAGFEFEPVPENWEDSFVFRGGLQYQVNESFALRAGFLYDQTPQPVESMDPILPDANRWAVTGGFGYKSGNFVIDVAYQLEFFADRTSPNREIAAYQVGGVNLGEGTYSTTAHLIGVSFGFIF